MKKCPLAGLVQQNIQADC